MICGKCDGELSGNIIQCDGVCGKKFHLKCADIKMNQYVYKALEEIDNLKYMCNECKKNDMKAIKDRLNSIMSFIDIYNEQARRNASDFEIMKKMVNDLKESVENKNCEGQKENLISYAEKVKATGNKTTVVVMPKNKNNQKSEQTKKEIKNKIDPTKLKIERVRNMPAGGIAVECASSSASELLKTVAIEKLGNDYDIETPELKRPCIKIVDMSDEYNEEEIIEKLKLQNEIMENAEMKVLNMSKVNKRWYNAIIQIDSYSFEKCMAVGRVNIGWERCRIFEYLSLKMCFNCCGFNHKASNCKNNKACKKCSENHDFKDCKSEINKCINCVIAVEKLKLKLDVDHRADDFNCKVFMRKKIIERSQIEYEK